MTRASHIHIVCVSPCDAWCSVTITSGRLDKPCSVPCHMPGQNDFFKWPIIIKLAVPAHHQENPSY